VERWRWFSLLTLLLIVPSAIAALQDLKAALLQARTEKHRQFLIQTHETLLTSELAKSILDEANNSRLKGNYPRALMLCDLARKVFQKISDSSGTAQALNDAALVFYYQDKYQTAIEYNEKSLALREELNDKHGIAESLNNIGRVYYLQEKHDIARDYFQKSLAVSEAIHDDAEISDSYEYLGNLNERSGNFSEALEDHQKSLQIRERLGDKSRILHSSYALGHLFSLLANFDDAMDYLKKSLALAETLNDQYLVVSSLNEIGYIYLEWDDHENALQFFVKSLKVAEQLKSQTYISNNLMFIGYIHFAQGNYSLAREYYQKSLNLSKKWGIKSEISQSLRVIGRTYDSEGDFNTALAYYNRSLKLYQEWGDLSEIETLSEDIGGIHMDQGKHEQALKDFQKCLQLNRTLGNKSGLAVALNNLSDEYLRIGEYQKAVEAAQETDQLSAELGMIRRRSIANTIIGQAQLKLDHPDLAEKAFEKAIELNEELRSKVAGTEQEQERSFENKLEPYHNIIELLIDQNRTDEAFTFAERAKARVLLDVLHTGRTSITKAMTAAEQHEEKRLNHQLTSFNAELSAENQKRDPDPKRISELNGSIQKARLDYEAFQTTVSAAHPELKIQRGEVTTISLQDSSAHLVADNTAILEYVVAKDKTFLFVIEHDQQQHFSIDLGQKVLAARIENLRKQIADRNPNFHAASRELFKLLIAPSIEMLKQKTSLIIVPDAELWNLPFQALEISPNHFLLEDFEVSYVPSVTVLREMSNRHTAVSATSLLAIGNPHIQLTALPESEVEVKKVATLYDNSRTKIYVGKDATESRFKAEAGNYSILHLATHGIVDNNSPMYSKLVFSQTDENADEDGFLEAWEILNLNLNADLVILSACDTAQGRIGPGEGMIGLAWTLFVAGASTTVVSQWEVDSTSTTALMIDLHRNLQLQHLSKQEALRQAELKLLKTKSYHHPFYWAGFVLIGNVS
jgi:CHAT domain-containing protein/tetratricopeptide (TPR) repeat protein